ncbi:hypothetical protein [Paenibacillus stellifer]|uniref:hypothetical protein n=1 Tax=Paenibacillus stellifer TaxID=169760 RepID=UPI00068A3487|nr:hypothetical protein [Paenibacillus stellifer]
MDYKLPIFFVIGASGSGKTAVSKMLRKTMPEFDIFSTDMLHWMTPTLDERTRMNITLRSAYSIARSGRGTIICGNFTPWDAAFCEDYAKFSQMCYINLHCDRSVREKRLMNRFDNFTWTAERFQEHHEFAELLLQCSDTHFDPPLYTIDTGAHSVPEVAALIKEYVMPIWNAERNLVLEDEFEF